MESQTQLERAKHLRAEQERISNEIREFMNNIDVNDPEAGEVMMFILKELQKEVEINKTENDLIEGKEISILDPNLE